jgi:hypothetical protein
MPPDERRTREYAERHLVYEIQMVEGLVARFKRFDELLSSLDKTSNEAAVREVFDLVGRNSDIESFAIHCRALIDFLYDKKKPRTYVAKDFFEDSGTWSAKRPAKTDRLRSIPQRASTEVAHLSYDRSQPAPPWDYVGIWEDLSNALRVFVEEASEKHLSIETRDEIARLLPPREAAPDLRVVMGFDREWRSMRLAATEAPKVEIVDAGGTATIMPSPPAPSSD